jgi:hypothetical protein
MHVDLSEVFVEKTPPPPRFYVYGGFIALLSAITFYLGFSEGGDIVFFGAGGLALATISFVFFSPWRRLNYLIGGIAVSGVGIWLFAELSELDDEDLVFSYIWALGIGLWGAALLARAFGNTLSGIIKDFFQSDAVKTTGSFAKQLFKYGLWLAMIAAVVWLIIALGPLWIIAIILLLILFVLMNK